MKSKGNQSLFQNPKLNHYIIQIEIQIEIEIEIEVEIEIERHESFILGAQIPCHLDSDSDTDSDPDTDFDFDLEKTKREIRNSKLEIGKKRRQKSRVFYKASSNFQFPISNFFHKNFNCFGATPYYVFFDGY